MNYVSDRVEKIINGTFKIKNTTSYNDFSINELAQLQKAFAKKEHLTIAETGIWLGKSPSTIYRDIKDGRIVAVRTRGHRGHIRVNVQETLKNIRDD